MLPFESYQNKLDELRYVMHHMGHTPGEILDWAVRDGKSNLNTLRLVGNESVALIKRLPKSEVKNVLGMKLAHPVRAAQAEKILTFDENRLYEEIDQIEWIEHNLARLHTGITRRIQALELAVDRLNESIRIDSQDAQAAMSEKDEIEGTVLPALMNVAAELARAVAYCRAARKIRYKQIKQLNDKQLSVPKYNRRARRKRKARAARKAKAEAAEKQAEQDEQEGS